MELTKTKFKKTELGLIPEDWDSLDLNELGATGRPVIKAGPFGSSLKKEYYVSEGYKIYGQEQVIKNDAFYGDYFINQERYRKLKSCEVIPGDILLSLVGTFGKILVIPDNALKGIINPRLLRISVDKTKFHIEYISHFLKSTKALEFLESKLQGGTMGVLNAGILKSFQIPLPPTLTEQKAIATALSDVDDLIANLDKLITKKKAIKQGAMQQLLTPNEKWINTSLIELAENKKNQFDDGDWIESEYIISQGVRLIQTGNIGIGVFKDKGNKKYISEESFNKLNCKEVLKGDLLICRLAEPAGRACVMPSIGEDKVVTSVDVSIFRGNPEIINRDFLSQLFTTNGWFQKVIEKVGGTTHKRISRGALGKINIEVPLFEEQKRIALVLSDMDAEIEQLETKKAKYQDIKQGMMQELLTGKTRLV
ncbi:restriction endonuclease subunit S [Algoriphagus marinus]|uniref:restriction endonuclease subunit S n=1 Tax=Algoriphagus marinus TaxID=1925762 RepID=UPI00094B9697|nr:restriction endonuclease subunit S [Algoriphagus marinus]